MADTVRLDEYTKEEWWDIMRKATNSLGGDITRDEFEAAWLQFCRMKDSKKLQ